MLIYLYDDAESDIRRLKNYLNINAGQTLPFLKFVTFSSCEDLLAAFKKAVRKPGLIFLDISRPEADGLNAAKQLRSLQYQGGIIFTAPSAEYASYADKADNLYFLQKPYDYGTFEDIMAECGLFPGKNRAFFTFVRKKEQISVPCDSIIFFETVQSHTVLLHTTSGVRSFPGTLTQIAKDFSRTDAFLRIGRSFLVNLNHVNGLQKNDLVMSDGSIVQVPIRRQREVLLAVEIWNNRLTTPL